MTTRSSNIKRAQEFNEDPILNDVPIIDADTVYEGAMVGDESGAGYGRPLVAGDIFLGMAVAKCANEAGANGAKDIRVMQRGTVELSVTGVTGVTDINDDVFADDDDSFTLTDSSNSSIGTITRWVSGTTCMVRLEANQVRSI